MSYFVDLHCHLDLYPDFEKAINDCERNEIFTLAVTTIPAAWPQNKALTATKKFVRPALGLHPQLVNNPNARLDLWDKYFEEAKYIGEIGLDAGPKFYPTFEKQQKNFSHILERCATTGGKVLSIHSARTAKVVLDALAVTRVCNNNKVILHWFTGTPSEAKKAVEMGCYFSINVAMLRGGRASALFTAIPINRILTETDGPFLTDKYGPVQIDSVVECVNLLASKFEVKPTDMKKVIFENFTTVLRN